VPAANLLGGTMGALAGIPSALLAASSLPTSAGSNVWTHRSQSGADWGQRLGWHPFIAHVDVRQ
jgi:hypothetical protein